jgi:tetratricopeptide (TPR) repeat protein
MVRARRSYTAARGELVVPSAVEGRQAQDERRYEVTRSTSLRRLASTIAVTAIALFCVSPMHAGAQQPISRLKGRVMDERGDRLKDAEVRAEAMFGSGAGTFAGQRQFSARTNAKGEWSILGIAPGIWLFEVVAADHSPETVALPIRLLTASGPNAGGQLFTWELILKATATPAENRQGHVLVDAAAAAQGGQAAEATALLGRVPDDADGDYLAAAGRVALLARQYDLARTFFMRALERDPSSYRAALGIASMFLLRRDFDNASRAFDAARSRTRDKDEQRFISAAIGDLATIRYNR